MENKGKLSTISVAAFGMGDFGKQCLKLIMGSYMMFYFVTVTGLSASAVGVMMMVAKIWDAINDPMMGYIVDNTHSKYGKVRPYLLYVPIPLAICYIAMFAIPQSLSMTGRMVWATVAYIGTGMAFTAIDIPGQTLMMRMTTDNGDRMRLQRSKMIVGTVACALPPILIPSLIAKSDNLWNLFAVMVTVFVVIAVACYWLMFAGTRETVDTPAAKIGVFDAIKVLARNKYYLRNVLAYLVYGIGYTLLNGMMLFYIIAKFQDASLATFGATMMMVGMLLSSIICKNVAVKFGKIKTSVFAMVLSLAGFALRFVMHDSVYTVMAIWLFLHGAAVTFYNACLQPMVAETVDYGELKTGVRVESFSFAGLTLTSKIGDALGTAFVGFLLDGIGYVRDAATQTEAVVNSLHYAHIFAPAAAMLIILLIYATCDMDKKYPEYREALKQKRESEQAPAAAAENN